MIIALLSWCIAWRIELQHFLLVLFCLLSALSSRNRNASCTSGTVNFTARTTAPTALAKTTRHARLKPESGAGTRALTAAPGGAVALNARRLPRAAAAAAAVPQMHLECWVGHTSEDKLHIPRVWRVEELITAAIGGGTE